MQLIITTDGVVHCVYDELINLAALGAPAIRRASHVEPDERGQWLADLSPIGGDILGPFERRSDALAAERHWLDSNWLSCQP